MSNNIIINIAEEYKIKIEKSYEFENSIFKEVYESAKYNLIEIIEHHNVHDSQKTEFKYDVYNNIICFVGERGQGKSSSMISFLEALISKKQNDVFLNDKNNVLQNVRFTTIDLIDPSLFSGKETLFEIILAKMFSMFRNILESDGNRKINEESKRQLVDLFQKVFDDLKFINNRENIYKQDALDALIKLSTSSNLKENFEKLVEKYLNVICPKENAFLVIAIDDFDLKIEGVYDMLEDVRRFLIAQNIILLIACKIEQLQEATHAHIYSEYIKQLGGNTHILDNVFDESEIKNKALKFIEKLIPESRKIELPNVSELDLGEILVREKEIEIDGDINKFYFDNTANGLLLETIYDRLFLFLKKQSFEYSIFLKSTLRSLISLLLRLNKTDDIEIDQLEKLYIANNEFKKFFKDFVLYFIDDKKEVDLLLNCNIDLLNFNIIQTLKLYFPSEVSERLKDIRNYNLLQNDDIYATFFTIENKILDDDINYNRFESFKLLYIVRQLIYRIEFKGRFFQNSSIVDTFNQASLINTELLFVRLPKGEGNRGRDHFTYSTEINAEKNIFDIIRNLDAQSKNILASFVTKLGQYNESYRDTNHNIFDISLGAGNTGVSTLHFSIFSFFSAPYNLINKVEKNYGNKVDESLELIYENWINSEFYYLFNNVDFVSEFYIEFCNAYLSLSKDSDLVNLSYYNILKILLDKGLSRTFANLNKKYSYLDLSLEKYYNAFSYAKIFADEENDNLKDVINYIYENQKNELKRFKRIAPNKFSQIENIQDISSVKEVIKYLTINMKKSFNRKSLESKVKLLDADIRNIILDTKYFNSLFRSGGNNEAFNNREKLIKDLEKIIEKHG